MSEDVVKEERGADGQDYRVRLVQEYEYEPPYDEGSVPLWRVEYRGTERRVEQVKMTSFDASDVYMTQAVEQFGGVGNAELERWLRIWHGTTVVEWWYHDTTWYVAADTDKWRQHVGATPEAIRKQAEDGSLMAEYKAWCQGEVYGYVIERRLVAYTTVVEPADGKIIGSRRTDEWFEVDDEGSMSGLYGADYAQKVAIEDFDAHIERVAEREREAAFERRVHTEGR